MSDASAAFSKGDYTVAVQQYTTAIPTLQAGDERDLASLNAATCYTNLKQYDDSVNTHIPFTLDLLNTWILRLKEEYLHV